MKILLVHQNFPGQFLHLAPALAARGHEVLGLTAESNQRPAPGKVARYRWNPEKDESAAVGGSYQRAVRRGTRAARAALQLREKHGFVPDVIFGHCGWGETLFLREIWPEARHLAYAEFMYQSSGLDTDFDPEFRNTALEARIGTAARRAHMLQAMIDADAALAPTRWQASTFPADLRHKISVIHDGVDCGALARPTDAAPVDAAPVDAGPEVVLEIPRAGGEPPLRLHPGDEVLSFVNRRLEPYRGFHVFMRALPQVLAARPEAQVVIVGSDGGQGYGNRPSDGRCWREVMLEEVGDRLDLSRVHFLGHISYQRYRALLQLTRAHVYLTYPFVLSWSLIEAMAAGAPLIASRTPPVAEAITDGVEGQLVDFFDIPGWAAAMTDALANPQARQGMAAAAQTRALRDYDLQSVCLPRLVALVESLGPDQAPKS